MLQDSYYSTPYQQPSFLGNVLLNASRVGGRISDLGQDIDNRFVNQAQSLDYQLSGAASQAESELTQRRLQQYGGQAAGWLSQPMNLAITVLVIVAVLFGIRKL